MNNNSLEQTFTNTANAIRAKLHTQDGIAPDNFASEIAKISGGSGDTGIYHVNTLAERDSLSAKDSDICLVHSIQETEISVKLDKRLVGNAIPYIIAWAAGSVVTCFMLGFVKKDAE